ncbi:MAG: glycoside hydrolase family 3 C-terminal domain-containing protein [Clostridia bacterium]|nr:glycoside hydrolase family 3 C-terminal domain-containing protein [Clostridia bacterium]
MRESDLIKLLNEMSLTEKIGELCQMPGEFYQQNTVATGENKSLDFPDELIAAVGSTLNVTDLELIHKTQKEHIEKHPHHIPMLFMLDIIHGFHTTFPIPLAQACSFDPDLVKRVAQKVAKEACACGINVTFSPMVDLVRDARWGRVMESSGEDPYLNAVMAKATVEGYQGDDLKCEGTISACVKHFAAYGGVEGGREYGAVDVSERNLRQYYLPAYKAACDAGCGMLMSAFNVIGGVPCTANYHLMNEILRKEWGYEGAVISDYGSITNMRSHGISEDDNVLAEKALNATVDIEMCIECYAKAIPELIESGKITMSRIDEAVLRVLNLKNRLGLFENPYRFSSPEKAKNIIRSEDILELARESVSQSSVLLKNEDNILPLDKTKKIAFIGPFLTERNLLGGWSVMRSYKTQTVMEALSERLSGDNFKYINGCKTVGAEAPEVEFCRIKEFEADETARIRGIKEAAKVAADCDTVVLFLGEHPCMGGELTSRTTLEIPEIQKELLRAVSAVNKNVAVVLFNHRPLDLREISNKAKAILAVWFPGTMGAMGVADMLLGDRAPSGRLAMSFPYSVGQLPIYYSMLPSDHSPEYVTHFVTGYTDCPIKPLYCFGEGLTYTDFAYGDICLDKSVLHENEVLKAGVTVTNTGTRAGFETVQLYIRDRFASVSRPLKELRGFKKVSINPGETVTVEFELTVDDLRFYNENLEYVWEPGEIQVFIGHDSKCENCKSFEIA